MLKYRQQCSSSSNFELTKYKYHHSYQKMKHDFYFCDSKFQFARSLRELHWFVSIYSQFSVLNFLSNYLTYVIQNIQPFADFKIIIALLICIPKVKISVTKFTLKNNLNKSTCLQFEFIVIGKLKYEIGSLISVVAKVKRQNFSQKNYLKVGNTVGWKSPFPTYLP